MSQELHNILKEYNYQIDIIDNQNTLSFCFPEYKIYEDESYPELMLIYETSPKDDGMFEIKCYEGGPELKQLGSVKIHWSLVRSCIYVAIVFESVNRAQEVLLQNTPDFLNPNLFTKFKQNYNIAQEKNVLYDHPELLEFLKQNSGIRGLF